MPFLRLSAVAFVAASLAAAPCLGATVDVNIVFSADEKRIIYDFFGKDATVGVKGNKAKGKPGRSGGLSPGLQRHLERHGTLPPGLAKRDLPPGLASRLPPTQPGIARYIVDNDVLLIVTATGLILDILEDVLD